jgi:hypothetical protein
MNVYESLQVPRIDSERLVMALPTDRFCILVRAFIRVERFRIGEEQFSPYSGLHEFAFLSGRLSILFAQLAKHPLANVGRAMLNFRTIGFA